MSDGEAFEGVEDVVAEARRAGTQNISLVTVGFGTAAGANIPIREGNSNTVKRDDNGQVVVTHYQPEFLRAAAQAANGTFIDAAESDKATRVRAALASLRRQQRVASAGETKTPRYQWFLFPAVLLFALDTLLGERRGRRVRKQRIAVAETASAAAMIVFLLAGCARQTGNATAARAYNAKQYAIAAEQYRRVIDQGDKTPRTLYNYGTALLAGDSLAQAAEVLERTAESRDEELRYRSLFNFGLTHLKRGLALPAQQADEPLDAALAAYKKVLLLRPNDMDAKWNYELALRKKKQGGGGGGGGSGQSENNPSPQSQAPKPSGGLGQNQAEQLLGSAAREERDVQAKRQRQSRVEPPPGGKDW